MRRWNAWFVGQNLSFQGFVNPLGADLVTVAEAAGNGYYTLDDLQVGSLAPGPGSIVLVLSALAAAGLKLRRRR